MDSQFDQAGDDAERRSLIARLRPPTSVAPGAPGAPAPQPAPTLGAPPTQPGATPPTAPGGLASRLSPPPAGAPPPSQPLAPGAAQPTPSPEEVQRALEATAPRAGRLRRPTKGEDDASDFKRAKQPVQISGDN